MAGEVSMVWHDATQNVPAPKYPILIKISTRPGQFYKAVRVDDPSFRFGYIYTLFNEHNQTFDHEKHTQEETAVCPSWVTEWCYVTL